MADKKISQLPSASLPLAGTEELPIVQGGQTVKATAQDVADLAQINLTTTGSSGPATLIANTLNIPEYSGGGGGITGSGTTNYLSKWTGSTALGDSLLFDDGTNVGIGTASPAYKLDVSGTIGVNTSGQTRTISTYYGANSDGLNIFIGGGGTSSVGAVGETYKGAGNTSVGVDALRENTTGYSNSAMGINALYLNDTGYINSAMGYAALYSNTTGYYNSAMGGAALYSNTTGFYNSAMGVSALYSNTTGYNNSAMGYAALNLNTTGYSNSAMGVDALRENTTGYNNSAMGVDALKFNTTGISNSAMGVYALFSNTTGYSNSAMGGAALQYNTTGYSNTGLGYAAGYSPSDNISDKRITTDYDMILIGFGATKNSASQLNNSIAIGVGTLVTTSNTAMWGNGSMTSHIFQAGNVGIGTTSPAYKLDVTGEIATSIGVISKRATSNTAESGPYLALFNSDATRKYITQLNTNNGIDWHYYDGSTWAVKASLTNSGGFEIVGDVKTAAPTGGTSKKWRLGAAATVTPSSPDRTIEVEIDGTLYYIHAKTTND